MPIVVPNRFDLCPPRRGGFTLLELMLVLSILVLVGALATPMLGDLFERQKLQAATETIRLQWEEARLKAMKTGQAQVFTCELGTGSYAIKPLLQQSDATNVGTGATLAVAGGLMETQNVGATTGMVATAADVTDFTETLEDKITFFSCRVASEMRAYTIAQESQSSGGDVNTQNVAQAVIFYPDGSSSTAELQINNERGDVRGIRIRGLTGQSQMLDITNVPSESKN